MTHVTASTEPGDALTGWLCPVASVVPGLVLLACLLWVARTRRTLRRSLEEARRDLERRSEDLRQATDLAEVGVWFWDLSSGAIEWTDRCQAHLSLPPGRPPSLGQFFSSMHPEDRERVRLAIDASLAGRQDYRTAFRVVRPDGTISWIAALGRGRHDPEGRPVSMGGVTIDVTRLRTIEEELKTLGVRTRDEGVERHRLRGILEAMLDPLAILRPVRDPGRGVVDFLVADANPAACAWLGIGREHLLGGRLLECVPQFESSGLLRQFVDLAEAGRPLVVDDFPFPLRGMDLRRMEIRGIRVADEVALAWRDVTERHASQARIAESEEQFRLLAENALDVVVRLDAGDRVRWVSPSIAAVLGWAADDWVGRAGADILASDESRDAYLRETDRAMAGQGLVSRATVLGAAGRRHWMEVHTSPYRTQAGQIDGMVATLRIVDTEVWAEQALDRRARTDELTNLPNFGAQSIAEVKGKLDERGLALRV